MASWTSWEKILEIILNCLKRNLTGLNGFSKQKVGLIGDFSKKLCITTIYNRCPKSNEHWCHIFKLMTKCIQNDWGGLEKLIIDINTKGHGVLYTQ